MGLTASGYQSNASGGSCNAHCSRDRNTVYHRESSPTPVSSLFHSHCEASKTVMEEPSSIEKPREGDIRVSRLPRTRITF